MSETKRQLLRAVVLASLSESDFVLCINQMLGFAVLRTRLCCDSILILRRFKDEKFVERHISSCRSGIELYFGRNRYNKFDGHRVLTRSPSAFRSK